MNTKRIQRTKLIAIAPATSTTPSANIAVEPLETLSDPFEFEVPAGVKPLPKAKKTPMLDLICKAIEVIGVPKKGASFIGIKQWILNCSESMRTNLLIASLKRAFKIGLEKGVLGRPARCKDMNGLVGSFVVLKKILPKEGNPKMKVGKGKPESEVNKTKKAKAKSESKAKSTNPTTVSPTQRLANTIKESGRVEETNAASKKSKALSVKTLNAKASKVAAKRTPGVSVHKTSKAKQPKVPAKKTPEVSVHKTSKAKQPKVPAKRTPKSMKRVGETEGASKRTKTDKPMPVFKAKEPSHGIGEALPKIPKPERKIAGTKVQTKEIKPRRLYSSHTEAPTNNLPRKDLSDTELEVKRLGRKSLKSYSSDTDINAVGSEQINVKQLKKLKPKKIPK